MHQSLSRKGLLFQFELTMFLGQRAGGATPGNAKVLATVTIDHITVAHLSPVHSVKNEAATGHAIQQAPKHAVNVETTATVQWIRLSVRIHVIQALLEFSVQHTRAAGTEHACTTINETVAQTETPLPPALSIAREIFDIPIASGCGKAHSNNRQGLLRCIRLASWM